MIDQLVYKPCGLTLIAFSANVPITCPTFHVGLIRLS